MKSLDVDRKLIGRGKRKRKAEGHFNRPRLCTFSCTLEKYLLYLLRLYVRA
jgi:hypothetical protein